MSAAALLLSVVLSTLLIAAGGGDAWRIPFHLICHGQTDRAFAIGDTAMTICSRCTGVYAGLFLGALLALVRPPRRRTTLVLILGLLMAAPMVIDGTMQTLGVWSTSAEARAATGVLFGIALIAIATNALAEHRTIEQPAPPGA